MSTITEATAPAMPRELTDEEAAEFARSEWLIAHHAVTVCVSVPLAFLHDFWHSLGDFDAQALHINPNVDEEAYA